MQDDRARDDGEHALETQQDGDDRWVGVLLCEDLQRVAHAARHHADIEQIRDAGLHRLERGVLAECKCADG